MTRDLAAWLEHAEAVHLKDIEFGLDRVRAVADALDLLPLSVPSMIVAGTNGKGSTVAAAEAILTAQGRRVGSTLSPHIHRFNERVRIDAREADDDTLICAFEAVEAGRLRVDVPLTYFEFNVLVALWAFRDANVDVVVLEVGLGGRLDAFNIVDADVAVITSIGLDHQSFLGDTREAIGAEKAGVMRRGRPVVLGRDMPSSVTDHAKALGCPTLTFEEDFQMDDQGALTLADAASPMRLGGHLPAHNVALATVAVAQLVQLDSAQVERATADLSMPGRMELVEVEGRRFLLDVAHNPAGAAFLARELTKRGMTPRIAIYGALADKPSAEVQQTLSDHVPRWFAAPTEGLRGQTAEALCAQLEGAQAFADFPSAASAACSATSAGDVILVFGSFSVVEAAHRWMSSCATG